MKQKKPNPLTELLEARKAKFPQFQKFDKNYGVASRVAIAQNMQRASGKRGK